MTAPKHATRPAEGHPDELIWLRGYEAGVIDMGEDYATLAAKCEALERARDAFQGAIRAKGGTEHAPTQWAYDQACAAIEKHRNRAEALAARVRSLEEALRDIARQKLTDEIEQHMLPYADFEAGYNQAVQVARAALSDTPREEGKT